MDKKSGTFDKLLKRTREFAKTNNIKPEDINDAVKIVRSRIKFL